MIYIGIDPGKGGGLAALHSGGALLDHVGMPETEADLISALLGLCMRLPSDAFAVLEKVHASPQMGVSSAFTFGRGYGTLRTALVACGIPFDEVTPQKWQKTIGGLRSGTPRADGQGFKGRDKNVSKARAQELFPAVRVTHKTADALLIAEYCRRLHERVPVTDVAPFDFALTPKVRRKKAARTSLF